jgi:hypothetical protein
MLLAACGTVTGPAPADNIVALPTGIVQLVTASGGHVYWADEDSSGIWSIERVSESGGAIETVVTGIAQPGGLTVSGATVYFTDPTGGTLLSTPATGLPAGQTPAVVAAHLPTPLSVVIVAGDAYISESGGFLAGPLVRVPLDASTAPVTLAPSLASSLVTDGTAAYFVFSGMTSSTDFVSTIDRDVVSDEAPQNLFGTVPLVMAIAVNGTDVVSLTLEASSESVFDLVVTPVSGGAPFTLATGLTEYASVAATSTAAYWSDGPSTWMVPLSGGTPTQVSTSGAQLTVDGDQVFGLGAAPSGVAAILAESAP